MEKCKDHLDTELPFVSANAARQIRLLGGIYSDNGQIVIGLRWAVYNLAGFLHDLAIKSPGNSDENNCRLWLFNVIFFYTSRYDILKYAASILCFCRYIYYCIYMSTWQCKL